MRLIFRGRSFVKHQPVHLQLADGLLKILEGAAAGGSLPFAKAASAVPAASVDFEKIVAHGGRQVAARIAVEGRIGDDHSQSLAENQQREPNSFHKASSKCLHVAAASMRAPARTIKARLR